MAYKAISIEKKETFTYTKKICQLNPHGNTFYYFASTTGKKIKNNDLKNKKNEIYSTY